MKTEELQRIFSYSEAEQNTLAGLFLSFRVCNHSGVTLSTAAPSPLSGKRGERLPSIYQVTGKHIHNSLYYLRLFGAGSIFHLVFGKKPASMLYAFVSKKRPVKWPKGAAGDSL